MLIEPCLRTALENYVYTWLMNSLITQLSTTIQKKICKLGRGKKRVHKTFFPLCLLSLHFFPKLACSLQEAVHQFCSISTTRRWEMELHALISLNNISLNHNNPGSQWHFYKKPFLCPTQTQIYRQAYIRVWCLIIGKGSRRFKIIYWFNRYSLNSEYVPLC